MAVTADTDRILDILRYAAQSREIKNLSKVTKDTLAAVITYVAPRIVDPSLHSDLIKDLSAHPAPASNPINEVDDPVGTQTSSPLAMRPLSQTPINGDSEGFRRRVCRAIWRGRTCTDMDSCTSYHPSRCEDQACVPKRQPDCDNWHRKPRPITTSSQGNHSRGTRQPNNKVGGRSNNIKGRMVNSRGKEDTIQLLQLQLRVERQQRALEAARQKAKTNKAPYKDALLSSPLTMPSQTSTQMHRAPHSQSPITGSGHVPLADLTGIIATALTQALAAAGLGGQLSA